MNKYSTKIFKVDSSLLEGITTNKFINDLINEHNDNTSHNQYQPVETKGNDRSFEENLFVHNPTPTDPSWLGMIKGIVKNTADVKHIRSKYPSFLLFLHRQNEIYVISGGAGYRVIDSVLDGQFGFNVVERLIDTNKDDIRHIAQRVFLGVELASSRYFKSDYVFNDEDNFGKFYKELGVYINQKKLKDIGVTTSKNKLLVKGEMGFKIDSKITYQELVERVHKISHLLKSTKPLVELNPFQKLRRSELNRNIKKNKTLQDALNQKLTNHYYDLFKNTKSSPTDIFHPNLFEYLNCSTIIVKYLKNEEQINTDQIITPRSIFGILGSIDLPSLNFPEFRKLSNEIKTWILDDEKEQKLYECKLADWYFGEVDYDGNKYIKLDGEWYHYSIRFSDDLNNRLDKITDRLHIENMDKWTKSMGNEGGYNDSFNQKAKSISADTVFHKKIEVADIIRWDDNEVVFYHVKNGLNRDLRVLQSQLENSVKIVTEFRSDTNSESFKQYIERLRHKSEKLQHAIPSLDEMKKIFARGKVRFVFAFATETNNSSAESIIKEIKGTQSTIAKISILRSFYRLKSTDYDFSIAKIIRED